MDVFWFRVGQVEDFNGTLFYKDLSEFVLNLFCIPYSNAICERIFSKVNLIKTNLRNKFLTDTMSNIILASEAVKESGGCVKFQPS